MRIKASYSADYFPPAPVLPVRLAVQDEDPWPTTYLAMIDTGADGTFVPTAVLEELGVPVAYMTNARPHLGTSFIRVPVHKVDMLLFDTIGLAGIEVVGDDYGDQIILGRNVLNRLLLQLDGPKQTTTLTS